MSMGSNRKGGDERSTGSSDDLLTLLQRLKDSVSDMSAPYHAKNDHERESSPIILPFESLEERA